MGDPDLVSCFSESTSQPVVQFVFSVFVFVFVCVSVEGIFDETSRKIRKGLTGIIN